MKKKARLCNLSFLDVLFGALGAVLILFIIMLSMSGAPPRPRSSIHRTLNWKFDLPDEKPISVQIFYCYGKIDDTGEIAKDSKLKTCPMTELYTINTSSSIKEQIDKGILKINRELRSGEDKIAKSSLNVSIVIHEDDSVWSSGLCLLVKISDEANSNSRIPESAMFTITPSMEPASLIESPKEANFLCKFHLKEVNDGMMPFVLFFRESNKMEQENNQ